MRFYEKLKIEVMLLGDDYDIITQSDPDDNEVNGDDMFGDDDDNIVDGDGMFTDMGVAIKNAFKL